ncbi:hypothetical protein CB0940_09373 [Cercospora beticola]|uniref:Uncharacterized protein n=1 Tax=Cercospora beticola TaxID=122368 RepID=A0A2G5HGQ6_CERBT|nr:hypothetical protein CB0940_09373 [Cercospora beticola]PIA91685.1 hypothetical protein CB0940_09373 [Cercospora beticola]
MVRTHGSLTRDEEINEASWVAARGAAAGAAKALGSSLPRSCSSRLCLFASISRPHLPVQSLLADVRHDSRGYHRCRQKTHRARSHGTQSQENSPRCRSLAEVRRGLPAAIR